MSAELVDPFATHEPDLTPDEWVAIRDEIQDAPWTDPQRYPELIQEAWKTLGEIGLSNTQDPARTATQCLRRLAYRAHTGVPYDEPREPAWSLDSTARESLIDQDLWPDREPFIRHVDDVVEDL